MKLNIINQTDSELLKAYYPTLRKYYLAALRKLKLKAHCTISLIIVDSAAIQKLNKDYRQHDEVTDVLSFAELDGDPRLLKQEAIYLGDIFINLDRVISQAEAYEHSLEREFIFLFIHGLLHCLGYDHQNKTEEALMIAQQKAILGDLH